MQKGSRAGHRALPVATSDAYPAGRRHRASLAHQLRARVVVGDPLLHDPEGVAELARQILQDCSRGSSGRRASSQNPRIPACGSVLHRACRRCAQADGRRTDAAS